MELFEDLFLDPSAVLVNRCPLMAITAACWELSGRGPPV